MIELLPRLERITETGMEPAEFQPDFTVKDRLIALSASGLIVVDLDGKVTYANPSFARLWGYEHTADIYGQSAAGLFETGCEITAVLEKLKSEGGWSGELRAKGKDGRIFPILMTAAAVKKDTGGPVCLVASFTGTGAGQQLLEGLRAGNENLGRFLDNIHEGLWLLDPSGNITYANPRMMEILGYPVQEMLLKHIFYFMDVKTAEKTADYLERRKSGGREPSEVELIRRDGTKIATLFNAMPRRGVKGNIESILVSVEDLTPRKKAEDDLKSELEEQQKLRQRLEFELKKRSEFYRALVHELKTPLTPIIASSDLLVAGLHDEPWLSLARSVKRGTESLNSRIEELLDIARDELDMLRVDVRPVQLSAVITEAAEYMKPLVESRRQILTLETPEALPAIQADEARVRQVLLNLIGNASKYGPEGTIITVSAGTEQDNAIIRVRDNGKGMSNEDLKHMFELYYRSRSAANQQAGLGIGLSLCKRLIELQKGRIWVESEPDKGTVVNFTLPLCKTGQDQDLFQTRG